MATYRYNISIQQLNEQCIKLKNPKVSKKDRDRTRELILKEFDCLFEKYSRILKGQRIDLSQNDTVRFIRLMSKRKNLATKTQLSLIANTLRHIDQEQIKQELMIIFNKLLDNYKKVEGVDALGYLINIFRLRIQTWYKKESKSSRTHTNKINIEYNNELFDSIVRNYVNIEEPEEFYNVGRVLACYDKIKELKRIIKSKKEYREGFNKVRKLEKTDEFKFYAGKNIYNYNVLFKDTINYLQNIIEEDEWFTELELRILYHHRNGKTLNQIATYTDLSPKQVELEIKQINKTLEYIKEEQC